MPDCIHYKHNILEDTMPTTPRPVDAGRYVVLTESAASDTLGAARARAHRAEDTGLVTRLLDTHTGKLVEF